MKLYIHRILASADLTGEKLLTPQRRARLAKYIRPQDQASCLAAGLLLRYAFGDLPEPLQNAQGKPYFPHGPHFNLSHSGEYVILGVSDHSLGVDVEQLGDCDERVARRCYTAKELEWLHAQADPAAFYRLWTAKESIMKATGLGFSLPPESFCVLPVENGPHTIGARQWFLRWWELPGYALCCATATEEEIQPYFVSREQLLDS